MVLLYQHSYYMSILSWSFSHQRKVLGLHSYSHTTLLNPDVEGITSFVLMEVEQKMEISQVVLFLLTSLNLGRGDSV